MGTGYHDGISYASQRSSAAEEAGRRDDMNATDPNFESDINWMIMDRLGQYNDRDTELINGHLEDILGVLREEVDESLKTIFGGSVKKHTYIDGLSDVDTLLLIDESKLSEYAPNTVKKRIGEHLRSELKGVRDVRIGDMAVTVVFNDGCEVQLLPAMRKRSGLVIQESGKNDWSGVVRPDKFAERLSEVNRQTNGKMVPLVKIFKGMNSNLPPDKQLTGYHIESLAIETFKRYDVEGKSSKNMLEYFCLKASQLVMDPIKDKTNQSLHVDDYLGASNSTMRMARQHALKETLEKMKRANGRRSRKEWDDLLGGP